jgi:uncharacterized phage protein gp47/JayE
VADLPNFNDLFRVARDEILLRQANLTRDTVEREGTDVNAMVAAQAAIGDEVIGQLAIVQSSLFLDSATEAQLDALVYDRYNMARKAAAPAIGQVEFSTTVANPALFTILTGTRLQTADGIQYITTATVNFPAGSVGPITANVRSALAGLGQQAKIGTITSIVDTPTGAAADLVVTNAAATAGAADAETDQALRERARGFWTNARRGTLGAILQGALSVSGVETATAFELLDPAKGTPDYLVELIVADQYTDLLADYAAVPAAYEAQSDAFTVTISNQLDDYRAGGIPVRIRVASVVMLPVQLALSYTAGTDVDAVTLQARLACVSFINALNPGANFIVADLKNSLAQVPGLVVTGNEVVSPAGDVVTTALQVLRTSLTLVVSVNC